MIYFSCKVRNFMKKNKYELMLTLKPSLPENVRISVLSKVENLINEVGLSMVSKDVWGKRYLAYPVKKHKEGYYVLYNLEEGKKFASKDIARLTKSLNVTSEVIRSNIFSVKDFSTVSTQKNV